MINLGRKDIHLTIFLIAIMIAIPFCIKWHIALIVCISGIVSLVSILLSKSGYHLILLAIALCIPAGWASQSITIEAVDKFNHSFRIISGIPYILIFLILSKKHYIPIAKSIILYGLLIFCIGLIEFIINNQPSEYSRIINVFSLGLVFFFICFLDKRMNLQSFFSILNVIFLTSSIYVFLDFFFSFSPYSFIYKITRNHYIETFRACGLMGHPLYLSAMTIIWQYVLLTQKILFHKISWKLEVICLLTAALTVSRTTIICILALYIVYLFLFQNQYKKRQTIKQLILLGGVLLMLYFTENEFINKYIGRFETGNSSHRLMAFPIVSKLFMQNPLGVGYFSIMESIYKGNLAKDGFIDNFTTVDNFFLSHIAAYGLFAIVFIAYYTYPLQLAYKHRKYNIKIFKSILLLYVLVFMLSFSFDWESRHSICLLVFGISGYLLRDLYASK